MLRQNNRIRVRHFYRPAKFFPERMVKLRAVAQIRRHVQPPAVRIVRRGYPFSADIKHIIQKLSGIFIVQLRQRVMSPPAVIGTIVGEFIFIMELKIIVVRAILINIGALFISGRILINPFPVQPFVKRPAVIEHAVQNNSHAPSVRFFHYLGKKFVTGLQIFFVGDTVNIPGSKTVLRLLRL